MGKIYLTTTRLHVRAFPKASDDVEVYDTLDPGFPLEEVDLEGWMTIALDDGSCGFVSRKFLVLAPDRPAPQIPAGIPPWIGMAKKYLGTKEAPGSADNPTILSWDKLMTTLPGSMRKDSTPWCAIYVHAMFHLCGIDPGVESAAAVDWLKFGYAVDVPKMGDVVVFRGLAGPGSHHVAFVMSVSGGLVHVIGGNQSDAVTLASYPVGNVQGYRRASEAMFRQAA